MPDYDGIGNARDDEKAQPSEQQAVSGGGSEAASPGLGGEWAAQAPEEAQLNETGNHAEGNVADGDADASDPIVGTGVRGAVESDALRAASDEENAAPAHEEVDEVAANVDASPSGEGHDTSSVTSEQVEGAAHEAAPAPDMSHAILNELQEIRTSLLARCEGYEQANTTLQAAVATAQREQLTSYVKPTFERFVEIHSALVKNADVARVNGDEGYAEDFSFIAQSVEEILASFDLDSVGAAVGDPFDRSAHSASLIRKTGDVTKDQTIAKVVRQGFRVVGEERVHMPARVVVWKYDENIRAAE